VALLCLALAGCEGVVDPCEDGEQNGGETDVDCGGSCGPCGDGGGCSTGDDCSSGRCISGICRPQPLLLIGLNARVLFGRTVSGEPEDRCSDSSQCSAGQFCQWLDAEPGEKSGYCRECDDGGCEPGAVCDRGWCHATCTADTECGAGQRCTNGICRKPHRAEFVLCNTGGGELNVDADHAELLGGADACAFARWQWAGETGPGAVAPGACTALQILFTPPEPGLYRARLDLLTDDPGLARLPLMLCGEAVEAACDPRLDGQCPDFMPCGEEQFTGLGPAPACGQGGGK